MEKLYYSKGVSKKAMIGDLILLIFWLILSFWLLIESEATVERYWDKYNAEEKAALTKSAYFCLFFAGVQAIVIILKTRSWTEIYQDSIRANLMEKSIACTLSNITSVSYSNILQMIVLKSSAGTTLLIVKDPEKAQSILKDLMYGKTVIPSQPDTVSHAQQTAPQPPKYEELYDETLL